MQCSSSQPKLYLSSLTASHSTRTIAPLCQMRSLLPHILLHVLSCCCCCCSSLKSSAQRGGGMVETSSSGGMAENKDQCTEGVQACHISTTCVNFSSSYECACDARSGFGVMGSGSISEFIASHSDSYFPYPRSFLASWMPLFLLRQALQHHVKPTLNQNMTGLCGGEEDTSLCCPRACIGNDAAIPRVCSTAF